MQAPRDGWWLQQWRPCASQAHVGSTQKRTPLYGTCRQAKQAVSTHKCPETSQVDRWRTSIGQGTRPVVGLRETSMPWHRHQLHTADPCAGRCVQGRRGAARHWLSSKPVNRPACLQVTDPSH